MSNDFDNNDWLNDNGPEDEGDDELDLDWLRDDDDDDETGASDELKLGVTGELKWRAETHEQSADSEDDDDLALDWQQDAGEDGAKRGDEPGLGVTGELTWRQDVEGRVEQQLHEAENMPMDWQQDDSSAGDEDDQEEDAGALDWQQYDDAYEEDAEPAGIQAYSDTDDDFPDDDVSDEAFQEQLPSWLQGMEDDFPDDEDDQEEDTGAELFGPDDEAPWDEDSDAVFEDAEAAEDAGGGIPDWLASDLHEEAREDEDAGEIVEATYQSSGSEAGSGREIPDWLKADLGDEAADSPAGEPAGEVPPAWLDADEPAEEPVSEGFSLDFGDDDEEDDAAGFSLDFGDDDDEEEGAFALDFGDSGDTEDAESGFSLDFGGDDEDEEEGAFALDFGDSGDTEDAFSPAATTAADDERDVPDWLDEYAADDSGPEHLPEPEPEDDLRGMFDEGDYGATYDEEDLYAAEAPPEHLDEISFDDADLFGDEAPAAEAAGDDFDLDGLLDDVSGAAVSEDDLLDDLLGETVGGDDNLLDDLLGDAEAAAGSEDDLLDDLFGSDEDFAQAETAEADDFSLDDLDFPDEEAPAPAPVSTSQQELIEDLFGGDEDFDSEAADDFSLDDLDFPDEEETPEPAAAEEEDFDWFAEQEAAPASAEDLAWLGDIEEVEEAVPAEADFLDQFDLADLDSLDEAEDEIPEDASLDDILANYDIDDSPIVQAQRPANEDFAAMFDSVMDEEDIRPDIEFNPDAPEWLRDVTVTGDEDSAVAIIRQQTDMPLEDLPERLQALHESGLGIALDDESADDDTMSKVLPGVRKTLTPAGLAQVSEEVASKITVTQEEEKRANLLRNLVGADLSAAAVAGTLGDVAADADALPEEQARRRRRTRARVRVDRLLVILLLAAAVIGPFFINALHVGSLPPDQFNTGTGERRAFDRVDTLQADELVLVAVEYGATGAGELDDTTTVLLRHILSKGAKPVIVSTNAIGILRAQTLIEGISGNWQANRDYYIIGYLPGNAIGLRNFIQSDPNPTNTDRFIAHVQFDVNGNSTGLGALPANDLALAVVIAERAEDMRNWAEQFIARTNIPVIAATGYAASPLAEPYVSTTTGIDGLLVGYQDAYTYARMLDRLMAGGLLDSPTPSETPFITDTPTGIPTESPVVLPTNTPAQTEEPGPVVTLAQTEEPTPTQELPPETPTDAATATEVPPSNTPSATPTPTPETPTSTPTPSTVTIGIVTSAGLVNVRSGPGTNTARVAQAGPGEEFPVIGAGTDDDGNIWYQIELPDGTEGWIADFLMELEERPVTPDGDSSRGWRTVALSQTRRGMLDKPYMMKFQDDPTPTPESFGQEEPSPTPEFVEEPSPTPEAGADRPTATAAVELIEATAEVTPEAPDGNVTIPAVTGGYEEQRWYAMTLGTIAAIVIIVLGNVFNLLRALLRRGED